MTEQVVRALPGEGRAKKGEPAVPRSYAAIVWQQFAGSRVNLISLWGIVGLVLLAVYAPVFASSQPFIWLGDDGLQSPWLHGLFFNRNVFSSGIDLFFNTLMVTLPLYVVALLWVSRTRDDRSARAMDTRRARRGVVHGTMALVTVGFWLILLFAEPRAALTDWTTLAQAGEAKALFAPLRMGYNDVLFGREGPGVHHLLGIDTSGRDVFVRMLFGTRVSLSVGVIAVSIYLAIGVTLGSIAGYLGGVTDILLQRVIEIFLCFPTFFIILTFISFLEQPSIVWVMVFIGVVGWTGPARLVRGEFLKLRNMDFVAAARAAGLPQRRIIFRHVLPNALSPVLVNATFGVASAVLVESSLSFLGIGDPSLPSWGRILALGRSTGDEGMMLLAGIAIFFTVSVLNLAGEGLRDALDPRLRR